MIVQHEELQFDPADWPDHHRRDPRNTPAPRNNRDPRNTGNPRLNLLLSYGGWDESSFAEQLPPLLDPMGISCVRVECGDEAAEVIQNMPVHIAVVDLEIPLHKAEDRTGPPTPAGPRVLQMLRRLTEPPPTVVVRPPQPVTRESVRSLSQALREGAFAVLDRPVQLESMLEVMRRVLRRYYRDTWPTRN